ncbi:MAG: pilus assembly protein [Candidatus Solibacter usitatus]|nr:pilus assembly protein [Candidatus Solibacter usitatus]
MRSPRRRLGQSGQGMVESALVLLSLLAMILFILDMGRILLLGQYVTERARETARAAVVNDWTESQVKNYLVYRKTQAPDDSALKPGFLGLLTSQVSYAKLGSIKTGDYRVQIQVSGIQAVMFIPYIAGKYKFPTVTVNFPAQSMGATN